MITLTGHESFAVLRNDPDTRLFEALMARQYRLRRAHDRQRPSPACGGWDDDDGGRAA